jgi:hypothetical protein
MAFEFTIQIIILKGALINNTIYFKAADTDSPG